MFYVVRPCIRDSRGSFMFPRYLQYLLTDFRQTFVTGASWDTDDLIMFLGQKVKVQGHTMAAEAHSTPRYRRVQLFSCKCFMLHVTTVYLQAVFDRPTAKMFYNIIANVLFYNTCNHGLSHNLICSID